MIRIPRSTESSYTKISVGVCLSASSDGDVPLQEPMRRAQTLKRFVADLLVSENAHKHACLAQIWAGLDSGHGYESDAGILQIRRDYLAEDSAHRFVNAPHPRTHRRTDPGALTRRLRRIRPSLILSLPT